MNLNYVNFDESSHWFDIEPLDFDGFVWFSQTLCWL